jgi:hypothetical protein
MLKYIYDMYTYYYRVTYFKFPPAALFLENLTFYGRALKSVAFAALVHKAAGEM